MRPGHQYPDRAHNDPEQLSTWARQWLAISEAKRVATERFGGKMPMLYEGTAACEVRLSHRSISKGMPQYYITCQVSSRFAAHPPKRIKLSFAKVPLLDSFFAKVPCFIWAFPGDALEGEPYLPSSGVLIHISVMEAIPVLKNNPTTGAVYTVWTVYPVVAEGCIRIEDFRGGKPCDLVSASSPDRPVGRVFSSLTKTRLPWTSDKLSSELPGQRNSPVHTLIWTPRTGTRADPRFTAYAKLVDTRVAPYDDSKDCRFPSGEVFSWSRLMPGMVWSVLGYLPIALSLRNRSMTDVVMSEVDEMVNGWILMSLVRDGTTTAEYMKAASLMATDRNSALLVTEILANTITAVGSTLEAVEDLGGADFWDKPLAGADLANCATDCEERSTLGDYAAVCILSTSDSNPLAYPLKCVLKNYKRTQVAMLARIGPCNDAESLHSKPQLHMTYALVPRRTYRRLVSNACNYDSNNDDKEDMPTPCAACPFLLCEGEDRIQASPDFDLRPRNHPGFGPDELSTTEGSQYEYAIGTTVSSHSEFTGTPFLGDVIAFYFRDDADARDSKSNGCCFQVIPVTYRKESAVKWRLGISMHRLMLNEGDSHSDLGLVPIVPRTSEEADLFSTVARLSSLIGSEWSHDTCLRKRKWARPKRDAVCKKQPTVLDAKLADAIVARSKGADRVVFVPHEHRGGGAGAHIDKIIECAVTDVRERALGAKNEKLMTLAASRLTVDSVAICDGIHACFVVAFYTGLPEYVVAAVDDDKSDNHLLTPSINDHKKLARVTPIGTPTEAAAASIAKLHAAANVCLNASGSEPDTSLFTHSFGAIIHNGRAVSATTTKTNGQATASDARQLLLLTQQQQKKKTEAQEPAWILRLSTRALSRSTSYAGAIKRSKK